MHAPDDGLTSCDYQTYSPYPKTGDIAIAAVAGAAAVAAGAAAAAHATKDKAQEE